MGDHHHHPPINISRVSKNLVVGIWLNMIYVVAEFLAGFLTNSLSLIADAGHNFSDASSLFLVLIAFKLIRVKAIKNNTYGYRKTSVLISLFNSLLIVFTVGLIVREAILRIDSPPSFNGLTVTAVAFIGVFINFLTAYLLNQDQEKDINIKGAYLHMLADGLVSLGVIVAGLLIYYTQAFWVDPVVSLIIAAIVLYSSWSLLKESFRLLTDAIPKGISLEEITSEIEKIDNVVRFHHVHIWALSTSETALTAHLVVSDQLGIEQIEHLKQKIKHELEHYNIRHSTLELEYQNNKQSLNC